MSQLYLIPSAKRLAESVALASQVQAHFEYNDFYSPALMDDPEACRGRMRLYQAADRDLSRDTMHGAFFDVTIHSDDPLIRQVSEKRVRQSMAIAKEMGLRGVVFHTGTIPNFHTSFYEDTWLRRNRDFWRKVAEEYPDTQIFMENMFDMEPRLLMALAEEMKDCPTFGVCLDYAHARVFGGDPASWVEALAPYVRHMHVNDNDGVRDLHAAVGEGTTDWMLYNRHLRENRIHASVLLETADLDRQRRSLAYMAEHKIIPLDEGGNDPC